MIEYTVYQPISFLSLESPNSHADAHEGTLGPALARPPEHVRKNPALHGSLLAPTSARVAC